MPTQDELEKQQLTLSAAKQALMEKRQHRKFLHDTLPTTISKRSEIETAPVSLAQQRLWFLDQLDPGNSAYNIATAMGLAGSLNLAALKQSLNEIVRRHEALRTTFVSVEGNPIQRIRPTQEMSLPIIDLRHLPINEREQKAMNLVNHEAQQPFDLAQGPLLRAQLLCLDEEEHVLHLVLHHIVADAWSMGVLTGELTTLYNAFSAGQPSPLPELSIHYGDYAYWQQQWLQGEVLERQLAYWKERLAGIPTALHLPTDHVRPRVQTFQGATQNFALPLAVTDGIRQLSRREGTTLFMTLLAAFQILLCRYTGQEDIVVGSSMANRMHTEIEKLIGCFSNTLVLRTDLSGNPTFQELLRRVREVALGAYSHQDVPFERAVQTEWNLSQAPLFQAMFLLHNTPMPTGQFASLTFRSIEVENRTAKFDVTLDLQETVQGLTGHVEYNTDLFEPATISRMAGHFQTLLEGIVTSPEQPISELPLLTEAERHQLIVEWNETRSDYPKDLCIHQLFEAQVERTPDAAALLGETVCLTYRELNQRANQLAHYLRILGVGPEVLVGLYMERSVELMVGLLGILKAGGAYLPLDPTSPGARLSFMLNDAQVPVLLTQHHLQNNLPEHRCAIVCLDTDWDQLAAMGVDNPVSGVGADNLAYAIYTSGSTGHPKGVLVPHSALVNHSYAIVQHYHITTRDHVLQFASISFDAAAEELFPSWCNGAAVVLRPNHLPATVEAFLDWIERYGLTILNLPTAYWHHWVEELLEAEALLPASLRLVIVGGEQASPIRLTAWQQRVGEQVQWSNTYGPTEATVTTTIYDPDLVSQRNRAEIDTVPIGRPIANTQVYVLDHYLQPVPIGIPGEVYIGGAGLARGYLNRPELTAERFIPGVVSRQPGARLYRTGDLARYLPDGNLEFLGRSDMQVKIRGFRIELGEIESVLREHPEVRECVVVAREDVPGNKRLIAYVILQLGQVSKSHELQHHLRERLPEYMVPSAFVELEALPLTTSGKIDRQALPTPERLGTASPEVYTMPRTPVEEVLVGIWAGVLGLEQVGIHDNFFELGGHSLLATKLVARIQNAFEIALPLRLIFEAPTVAGLVAVMLQDVTECGRIDTTARLLLSVMQLSDDEVEAMLAEKMPN